MKTVYRKAMAVLLIWMMAASLAGTALAEETVDPAADLLTADLLFEEITQESADSVSEELSDETVPGDEVLVEEVIEEPVIGEQIVEEPVIEEPFVEEPFSEEPFTEEPAPEETVPDETISDENIFDENTIEEDLEEIVFEEVIVSDEVVIEEELQIPVYEPETFFESQEEEIQVLPAEMELLIEQEFSDSLELEETINEKNTIVKITSSLVKGMYSMEVYTLQQRLEELGYLTPGQADGYFGAFTESAVKLFQAQNGLYIDGVAGPYTVACMNYTGTPFKNLTKGMYSYAVALMQQALKEQGYLASVVDGDFGNYTYTALVLFQSCNGLSKTGIGDIQTLTLLLSGYGAAFYTRDLKMGMQGSDVAALQKQLEKLGFYTGGVDGGYGAMSAASVSLFQAYNGWSNPTGVADWTTCVVMYGNCKSFSVLSKGATGNVVSLIQKNLIELGFLNSASGTLDNATVEALKKFQKDNGLAQDGIPSSATLQRLFNINAEGSSDYILEMGSSGDRVYKLQQKLCQLGFMVGQPDGYFGSVTYAAVCAYQAQHGSYYPTGVVNLALYKEILASTEYFVTLYWGCPYDSAVYAMQNILANNGMIYGPDGEFGYLTSVAIRQIQQRFNLPVTENADAATLYYVYNYHLFLDNRYNVQGYYSNTSWLIFINVTMNRCYIYQGSRGNWKLVYNWPCSTGRDTDPTVLGEFTTNFRSYTFSDGVTYSVYYTTSFYGPYYMHSILYKPYTFEVDDARLSLNLSHGCVRLDTENAYWVYTNIPLGTKVVVVK